MTDGNILVTGALRVPAPRKPAPDLVTRSAVRLRRR
jgi:hypothetical protein